MTRIEMNLISSNHAKVDTIEEFLFSSIPCAETRANEVANANYDFKQAKRIRKQLIKFQDTESEIST